MLTLLFSKGSRYSYISLKFHSVKGLGAVFSLSVPISPQTREVINYGLSEVMTANDSQQTWTNDSNRRLKQGQQLCTVYSTVAEQRPENIFLTDCYIGTWLKGSVSQDFRSPFLNKSNPLLCIWFRFRGDIRIRTNILR